VILIPYGRDAVRTVQRSSNDTVSPIRLLAGSRWISDLGFLYPHRPRGVSTPRSTAYVYISGKCRNSSQGVVAYLMWCRIAPRVIIAEIAVRICTVNGGGAVELRATMTIKSLSHQATLHTLAHTSHIPNLAYLATFHPTIDSRTRYSIHVQS
jgi:hypothetical protein